MLQVGRQYDSIPLVAGKVFARILRPKDYYRKYLARNASTSTCAKEDAGADVIEVKIQCPRAQSNMIMQVLSLLIGVTDPPEQVIVSKIRPPIFRGGW